MRADKRNERQSITMLQLDFGGYVNQKNMALIENAFSLILK